MWPINDECIHSAPKKIIITGASSGIGRELVRTFAASSWTVLAVARRKELLEELEREYPQGVVLPVAADLTTELGRSAVLQVLTPGEQGVYLIHNAGIAEPLPLDNPSAEHWEKHLNLNLTVPALLTALLQPYLRGGRVLTISSSLAHRAGGALSAYGVTKAGLLALTKSWNAEFNQQNIFFCSAQPGTVDTPMQDRLRAYPIAQFPAQPMFEKFKTNKQLLSPVTSAKFLKWLLCETTKEEFSAAEWNIYDNRHWARWGAKKGEVIVRDKVPGEQMQTYDAWAPFIEQYGKPMLLVLLGILLGVIAQYYFRQYS